MKHKWLYLFVQFKLEHNFQFNKIKNEYRNAVQSVRTYLDFLLEPRSVESSESCIISCASSPMIPLSMSTTLLIVFSLFWISN